jgi:hypothetical protein
VASFVEARSSSTASVTKVRVVAIEGGRQIRSSDPHKEGASGTDRKLIRLPRCERARGKALFVAWFAHQIVHSSEIVNGVILHKFGRLQSLDEHTDHRRAQLGSLFSIAANLPVQALKMDDLACCHDGAIKHPCQFFVRHPYLRHSYPLEISMNHPLVESGDNHFWHRCV